MCPGLASSGPGTFDLLPHVGLSLVLVDFDHHFEFAIFANVLSGNHSGALWTSWCEVGCMHDPVSSPSRLPVLLSCLCYLVCKCR
jgi:hypothetical protein